jgi:hypothetical protein
MVTETLIQDKFKEFTITDGELTVKGPKGEFKVKTALSDREKHLILCGGLLASL